MECADYMSDEKIYWSKDVADLLVIGTSTLRKWCLLLEENGYNFLRDEHERRAFVDHDVIALKAFKELTKNKGITLENASLAVVSKYNRSNSEERTLSATPFHERSQQRYNELDKKIDQLLEHNAKQDAFNQALLDRLEKQETYIDQSLKKRDEQLIAAIREIQETKLLAAATEENKPWWKKLFKDH
jgi:DNA-binding transcriptional MerR regulator